MAVDMVEDNDMLDMDIPAVDNDEAFKPISLESFPRLGEGTPVKPSAIINNTGNAPKRRGRPPKVVEVDQSQAIAKAKKDKTNRYAEKIVNEFNDEIMGMLIDAGVPPALLYKDGQAPIKIADSKYTETGNLVAIKQQQAKRVAGFVVELEYTNSGGKFIGAIAGTQSGTLGLAISGILAGYSIYQYGKTINRVRNNLIPLIQAKRANDEAMKQKADNDER
jgi:hypothetical protein